MTLGRDFLIDGRRSLIWCVRLGGLERVVSVPHWTYFMQILSNYNTKSLYHIENSVIKALKSDIFHSYTCEINIGDIWLQFEKLKKLRQMALSYRNIKNKC